MLRTAETVVSIRAGFPTGVNLMREVSNSRTAETQVTYLEYMITVMEVGGRFTAHVRREGGLIEHDGQLSEVWAGASCASFDRAVFVAKTAIDNDRIR